MLEKQGWFFIIDVRTKTHPFAASCGHFFVRIICDFQWQNNGKKKSDVLVVSLHDVYMKKTERSRVGNIEEREDS